MTNIFGRILFFNFYLTKVLYIHIYIYLRCTARSFDTHIPSELITTVKYLRSTLSKFLIYNTVISKYNQHVVHWIQELI